LALPFNSEHIGSKIVCDDLMKPAKNSIKPAIA